MPDPTEKDTNELKKTGQVLKDTVDKISDAAEKGKAQLLKYLEENTGQNKIGHLNYWGKNSYMAQIYKKLQDVVNSGAVGMFPIKTVIEVMSPFLKEISQKPEIYSEGDGDWEEQHTADRKLDVDDLDAFCDNAGSQQYKALLQLMDNSSVLWDSGSDIEKILTDAFKSLLSALDTYIKNETGLTDNEFNNLSDPDISEDEVRFQQNNPDLYTLVKRLYGKQLKDILRDRLDNSGGDPETAAVDSLTNDCLRNLKLGVNEVSSMANYAGLGGDTIFAINGTSLKEIFKNCKTLTGCYTIFEQYITGQLVHALDSSVLPMIETFKNKFTKKYVSGKCLMNEEWQIVEGLWEAVKTDMNLESMKYQGLSLAELHSKWPQFTSAVDSIEETIQRIDEALDVVGTSTKTLYEKIETLSAPLSGALVPALEKSLAEAPTSEALEHRLDTLVDSVRRYFTDENWSLDQLGSGGTN